MPGSIPNTNPPAPTWLCRLPPKDYWSTPFAETLLAKLDLPTGATILDVACGGGIPAFYLAHCVGPAGRVVAIDCNEAQLVRSRAFQGPHFPWLEFRYADVRTLPDDLGVFDRITGNLAFMFFRPDRKKALRQLVPFLKPGGQLVLTFPSLGTFDSLWRRVDQEMAHRGFQQERVPFADYLAERPSADEVRQWLEEIGLEQVEVEEQPLEVVTGPGDEFLYHPLLRGGFLDDVYECFTDQRKAEAMMQAIAQDMDSFLPLIAYRCVMAGWRGT